MAEEKEVSAVKSFLGELSEEEKDPLNKTSEDPFVKETEPKEEVVDEKPLPFNKDPKIQKYLDKREREIEERIKSSIQTVAPTQATDDFKEVMDSLTVAIGNDTPEKVSALNAFKSALTNLDRRASDKAIAHLEDIKQREVEADQEAEQELENAFDNIEESFNVDITSNNPIARKTRQEFVSFVEKIAPKDRNGDIVDYPDMSSAWETFSEIKKSTATPSRAKELASRSMARSSEAPVAKDIKGLNFDNIIEHITNQ